MWSKAYLARKLARVSGAEYVSRTGKQNVAKRVLDPCACKHECYSLVPENIRNKVFSDFYGLQSYEAQNHYLATLIDEKTLENSKAKKFICKYHVPFDDERVAVCKTAFLHIHSISEKRLRIVLQKRRESGNMKDLRSQRANKAAFPSIRLKPSSKSSEDKLKVNGHNDGEEIPFIKDEPESPAENYECHGNSDWKSNGERSDIGYETPEHNVDEAKESDIMLSHMRKRKKKQHKSSNSERKVMDHGSTYEGEELTFNVKMELEEMVEDKRSKKLKKDMKVWAVTEEPKSSPKSKKKKRKHDPDAEENGLVENEYDETSFRMNRKKKKHPERDDSVPHETEPEKIIENKRSKKLKEDMKLSAVTEEPESSPKRKKKKRKHDTDAEENGLVEYEHEEITLRMNRKKKKHPERFFCGSDETELEEVVKEVKKSKKLKNMTKLELSKKTNRHEKKKRHEKLGQ